MGFAEWRIPPHNMINGSSDSAGPSKPAGRTTIEKPPPNGNNCRRLRRLRERQLIPSAAEMRQFSVVYTGVAFSTESTYTFNVSTDCLASLFSVLHAVNPTDTMAAAINNFVFVIFIFLFNPVRQHPCHNAFR